MFLVMMTMTAMMMMMTIVVIFTVFLAEGLTVTSAASLSPQQPIIATTTLQYICRCDLNYSSPT